MIESYGNASTLASTHVLSGHMHHDVIQPALSEKLDRPGEQYDRPQALAH
jgi:hypothetical protein